MDWDALYRNYPSKENHTPAPKTIESPAFKKQVQAEIQEAMKKFSGEIKHLPAQLTPERVGVGEVLPTQNGLILQEES